MQDKITEIDSLTRYKETVDEQLKKMALELQRTRTRADAAEAEAQRVSAVYKSQKFMESVGKQRDS